MPARKYRDDLPEDHHATYDALISNAAEIIRLDHVESDSDAYMDVSLRMLVNADELLAVWDGQPRDGSESPLLSLVGAGYMYSASAFGRPNAVESGTRLHRLP